MSRYYYTSADSLYQDLCRICSGKVGIKDKYATLRSVFRIAVEQKLVDNRLTFTGLFAKVDYLIKEYSISFETGQLINTARKILFPTPKDKTPFSAVNMHESFPHDLKAVCLLVSALYDNAGIPLDLRKLFPAIDRKQAWGMFDRRLQRVIVDEWDDNIIYAHADNTDGKLTICYGKENKYLLQGNWQYLRSLLQKGNILNAVRIRMEGNICCPEIIILEPDFLVDVSTIASCFETYAESPLVYLVNKLKPSALTAPIMMGNLAAQFLDETVKGEVKSYPQSVSSYFHKNALGMASADIPPEFHHEAQTQKRNISRLIGQDLPAEVEEYDKGDVILEPTFFCETLGIQGRMDFLQSKGTVIIEQKSGKGDFIPYTAPGYNPDIPAYKESHYAQILLYRALMLYGFNMRSDRLKNVFLLYSRYPKGLLRLGAAPNILYRAIKLRNEIARQEISFAYNGMGGLETLTAEKLNRKGVSGKLWTQHVKPQINEILRPIQDASTLERAYYLRMLRFVEMEHLLSKTGNKAKEDSGAASKWLDSLEEKKSTGNIYDNLRIQELEGGNGMVEKVKLLFGDGTDTDMSNFRTGDIVVLYPYAKGGIPDACAQMVFRASISDITTQGITVTLRNTQMGEKPFWKPAGVRWAVEHDFLDSSFSPLYRGIHAFLSAPPPRRSLILSQREPEVNRSLTLVGDYGTFNTLVLRAKQACELFLVIGPPGTGKTSFGLLNIVLEELASGETGILLMAYTNRAVDEICSKLKGAGIDFVRIGNELTCSGEYKDNILERRTAACRNVGEVRTLIRDTRVFCGTVSSMNSSMPLFSLKSFGLAVIDEASQILEPHLLGLLSARHNGNGAIKKFILIGDHKQLPAVVQQTATESAVTEPELRKIYLTNCRLSLFERLLAAYRKDSRLVYMLTRQGRMHRDIAEFPNRYFYHNRLGTVPCPHQDVPLPEYSACGNGIADILATRRMAFLAAPSPSGSPSDKVNQIEAEMIAATMVQAYNMNPERFDADTTVGVIVPYRNQIATIRNAVDRYGNSMLRGITIDTVERYQGSERDIIIYGFTIQKHYQLNFLTSNVFEEDGLVIDRKLNVAMTRAREHLIIIGNPQLLCKDTIFSTLIKYARGKRSYFEIPPDKYCSGEFSVQPTGKDITIQTQSRHCP